jgi:hypothetical protein
LLTTYDLDPGGVNARDRNRGIRLRQVA